MKKAIVIILIALVAVTSAFAFKFNSLGIDAGRGFYFSADMEIIDNLDAYARLGFEDYVTAACFNLSIGAQYKVAELKISTTEFDVKPGLQFGFNFADETFLFTLLGTCQFAFETGNFTAFVRPGLGFTTYPTYSYDAATYTYHKKTKLAFTGLIEAGVAYLFK